MVDFARGSQPAPRRPERPRQLSPHIKEVLDFLGAAWHKAKGKPWADGTLTPFRDQHGVVYVAMGSADRLEYFPVGSDRFRLLVMAGQLSLHADRPTETWCEVADAFREATKGWIHFPLVHRRGWCDGALIYDLGDRCGAFVRVDDEGWTIEPGVKPQFRRDHALKATPRPKQDRPLWELMEQLFFGVDEGTRLVLAALLTGAFDSRLETPWPLIVSDVAGVRHGTRRAIKTLLDPTRGSLDRPTRSDELDQALSRQLIADFGDLHDWSRPLVKRLVYNPLTCLPAGNLTERPCVLLDGVNEPAYDRALLERCVPIALDRPALVSDELGSEFLGAVFDVLSQCQLRRENFDPAWQPGPLAGFAAHGQAVAVALGFEASCFDEALCEQLALRDRLVVGSDGGPPW